MKTIPCNHEDVKDVVKTFCGQVFWLRTIRHVYEVLFENDESLTLMNKTAPSFFDDLNRILHNYILLEFSKITDPATTGGSENLTVDNLIESIDWPQDLQDKLTVLSNKAKDFRSQILVARNKLLAHMDKKAFLAGKTLGGFPEGEDEIFLKTLEEVCDITHEVCFGTIFGRMILAMPGDVINFRRALENAVAFNQLLSESSGQEMIRLLSYLEKARRPGQCKENQVPITREDIGLKLEHYSIPQGQCGDKAFEVAGLLLNQHITKFPETRFASASDLLVQISQSIKHGKIVIIWVDTGPRNPNNPMDRAIHCHFVFQDDPLTSFTVWPTPGVEFFDRDATQKKISDTIQMFGGIGVHIVPQ